MANEYVWNPEEDGLTHINIYSKGATPLGRWLTNFAESPFTHPVHGQFKSIEGFWYWLKTGKKHDTLRTLHGWQAKEQGKKYPSEECENFEQIIKTAIRAKLIANPQMLGALIQSSLPLAHYYVYGGKPVHAGYEWIVLYIEDIRRACHEKDYHPFKETK